MNKINKLELNGTTYNIEDSTIRDQAILDTSLKIIQDSDNVSLNFSNINNKEYNVDIPTATTEKAGVVSAKDYNYLHSLNSTKELSIEFTGSEEIIHLSNTEYPFIPKGVRIKIVSDTITTLRGYTEEFSKEFTIKDGYVTEDNIAILQNLEAIGKVTIKYTGAIKDLEKELTARIQGKSGHNNPLDDIVYLGNFDSYNELSKKLETLHSEDPGEVWDYCGLFTATIKMSSRVFIMNSCTSFENGIWQQSITGNVEVVGVKKELDFDSHGMCTVYRNRIYGSWSKWRHINEGIVTMTVTPDENTIEFETETEHGNVDYYYIPAATIDTAGVMSAEDKKALDTATSRALRALFIAAGAEYNDTDQIIQKTAPWETEEKWRLEDDGTYTYWEEPAIVKHLPKHYYLNGLGDITEEQMMHIYIAGIIKNNSPGFYALNKNIRTFIPAHTSGQEGHGTVSLSGLLNGTSSVESAVFTNRYSSAETHGCAFTSGTIYASFFNCTNLKYIQKMSFLTITSIHQNSAFNNCKSLVYVKINKLKCDLSWVDSSMISKGSVLYTIQNATPTTAITITLHPDAYARIANQHDIIEALEAQPLVTLVSA